MCCSARLGKADLVYLTVALPVWVDAEVLSLHVSGYTSFKELMWVVLPGLILLHFVTVALAASSYKESVTAYLQRGLQLTQRQALAGGTLVSVLEHSIRPLCLLALCGVAMIILNNVAPSIYKEHGGCEDPLVRFTAASIKTGTVFEWLWSIIASICSVCGAYLYWNTKHCDSSNEGDVLASVVSWLGGLHFNDASRQRVALRTWQNNMIVGNAVKNACTIPDNSGAHHHSPFGSFPATLRTFFYILLHFPFLSIASLPAFGFVSMQAWCYVLTLRSWGRCSLR